MALEKVPDALSFCSAKVERRKQKDWELIFVGEGCMFCFTLDRIAFCTYPDVH